MTNPHTKVAPHRPWGATQEESRPGTASAPSLPGGTPASAARAVTGADHITPDLADMAAHAQAIALEWYGLGVRDGNLRGYAQAVEDMAALQREQVRVARRAAQAGPYSTLADLRGDEERAERARAHERRIASMPSPTELGGWRA